MCITVTGQTRSGQVDGSNDDGNNERSDHSIIE
jgi:hypothetical protein